MNGNDLSKALKDGLLSDIPDGIFTAVYQIAAEWSIKRCTLTETEFRALLDEAMVEDTFMEELAQAIHLPLTQDE